MNSENFEVELNELNRRMREIEKQITRLKCKRYGVDNIIISLECKTNQRCVGSISFQYLDDNGDLKRKYQSFSIKDFYGNDAQLFYRVLKDNDMLHFLTMKNEEGLCLSWNGITHSVIKDDK